MVVEKADEFYFCFQMGDDQVDLPPLALEHLMPNDGNVQTMEEDPFNVNVNVLYCKVFVMTRTMPILMTDDPLLYFSTFVIRSS